MFQTILLFMGSTISQRTAWKQYRDDHPEQCKRARKRCYDNNPQAHIDRVTKNRLNIRNWFFEYKKTLSCPVCGEMAPECFNFHHKDKNKKSFNIGNTVKWTSIKVLKKELEKCIVLCANCHRKLHSGRISYEQIQPKINE